MAKMDVKALVMTVLDKALDEILPEDEPIKDPEVFVKAFTEGLSARGMTGFMADVVIDTCKSALAEAGFIAPIVIEAPAETPVETSAEVPAEETQKELIV